jgi:hypothetical protein
MANVSHDIRNNITKTYVRAKDCSEMTKEFMSESLSKEDEITLKIIRNKS